MHQLLTQLGVKCWMDVNGGMASDIYGSMADGVSNASVVVCFMSQQYQESVNCRLELTFAKQSGVEIVPALMQDGWKATGWLGLLTAGILWTRLTNSSTFEADVRSLHGQIQKAIGAVAEHREDVIEEVCDGATSPSEAKEELFRLRDTLEEPSRQATVLQGVMADPSQPATIPAGVPKLPARFQETQQIKELTRLVLSTSREDMAMPRVGFFGMGVRTRKRPAQLITQPRPSQRRF
eukprot:COSAG01_NODE_6725_length_3527_cov_1.558051_2_plen_237_part_00